MESNKNKELTFAHSNYFAPGTYMHKFKQEFSYAGVTNIITTTLLAPLERWRIIAQTQKAYPLRPKKFKNFFDYLSRIPKQQGFLSLWRGNHASIWIYIYQTLFQIGVYDNIKRTNGLASKQAADAPILTFLQDNFIFPFIASFATLIIIHPLDTYRIHRTMSYHKLESEALFSKFRHRMSQVGTVKNLYSGFWLANIISLININFYKQLYNLVGKHQIEGISPQILNTQMILSVLGVSLVHPLDTLKKIYQLNNMHKPAIFQGYLGVLKYLKQNKIQTALYNGFIASITRTALFIPIYWQILKQWKNLVEIKSSTNLF